MQPLYRIESREVSWLPQCSSRWLNIGSKCTKPAPQSQSTDPKNIGYSLGGPRFDPVNLDQINYPLILKNRQLRLSMNDQEY